MDLRSKIRRILQISTVVLRDASLENGAIVAANSDKSYYPRQAKDYHYVWPRDAGYVCVAAQTLGMLDIQEPFFRWLAERPEDFKKESRLYQSYSPNGRINLKQFQPDQMGTMLWAMSEFLRKSASTDFVYRFETLIRRLGDGLSSEWHTNHFFTNTVDLWEEGHRQTSTKMQNNHTYSLAACIRGLRCANEMIPNESWLDKAKQMETRLLEAYQPDRKVFVRNHGLLNDINMDASLLGLVFPFNIIKADDERMIQTVDYMERTIVENGGVHRYQFDYYDGEGTAQEGAGAWPLLNFWMSIYWHQRGNNTKAQQYFNWVVERVDEDGLIPEQMFEDFREGIKPLAWSHAMFVFAAKFLGYC